MQATVRSIFVVDDEPIIASTLARILEQSGFAATSFTNPLEALEAAHSEHPDLLLSDVMMPQLSGVELAMRIRDKCPQCRILLFSGQAATADLLAEARKRGHDFHILSKPVHPKDLLAGIHGLNAGPPSHNQVSVKP
jgi:CheY-like chemotaxis protein